MAYLCSCLAHYFARQRLFSALLGILALSLVAGGILLRPRATDAAADGNNVPDNIACQGWQRDTVLISFRDNDNDEADYRLERKIDGGAFTEIHTFTPNDAGGYEGYFDTGIDVTKQYRYRVRGRHGDGSYTGYSAECGNKRIEETGTDGNGFRIFYGLEGTTDACPPIDGNDVCLANINPVNLQKTALEGSADSFLRVGFDRDASVPSGGLNKIPVNVIWCDGGGCAGGNSLGLSPFLMETAFDVGTRVGDPIAYLVSEHEVFHFQQFKYGQLNDPAGAWVVEGQARSSQDKICIGPRGDNLCFDDIATGYAGYVPEINGYLGNTATPINQSAYAAALFWTYVVEKFGTFNTGDTVEGGMNLMAEFWKKSAETPNRDGIAVLNDALAALGTPMRFRDIWKDFAVANYAKNSTFTNVQAKYRYADMAQPGGNYNAVTFRVNQPIALNAQFVRTGETVNAWAAHYYRFTPAATVPVIDIKISQDTNVPVYYTIMARRGNNMEFEFNFEGRNLDRTLINNAYDEVVVIVAGLENLANYRVAINGTVPTLQILSPTTANKARVGSNAAPEKFRVAVQVLDSDGLPLAGVDLNQFNFRVGTVDVPADLVLTRAKIQDQQWFVLRAPVQGAAGEYDLHVNYANNATLAATQTLAVNYAPRVDADNMLIIDRSGSMAGPKLEAAKQAARLYVDSWRVGDKIGVVGYDHVAALNMELKDWTDSGTNTRQEAINAINALAPGGATAIGDALTLGFNEINGKGNPAHDWALILLSDGIEEGPITVDFPTAISNIAGVMGKRPVIHAIAIGPNADGPKMQNAATATGGTYQFVSEPVATSATAAGIEATTGILTTEGINNPDVAAVIANRRLDLGLRYRYVASEVLGHQQFYTSVGPRNDGDLDKDIVPIFVEGSAAELSLSLSFDGYCQCTVTLTAPGLGVIAPVETADDFRHLIWRVATPPPGEWQLIIEYRFVGPKVASADAPQQEEALPPYVVQGAVKSEVILDVDFPVPAEKRVSGVPMPIVATVTEFGPVTSVGVFATVTDPLGGSTFLTLWDDGEHGDGAADDGVFANTYYKTGVAGTLSGAGSYTVDVLASGNTANAGNFVRQKILGFYLLGSGDDDADGLVNEYEELHTGSPTGLDPFADPDNDGLDNFSEWQNGTDPFDPDTDDGGESDFTEINTGNNPFDPDDDDIEPTWAVAYPGVSKVFLRYAPRAEYAFIEIQRSDSFSGTYEFLEQDFSPTGIFTDSTVMNDQEYCYIVVPYNAEGHGAWPTNPTCATPKADPWPPDGGFLINDGASHTDSQDVTLTIFAADTVSPHIHEEGSLDALMEPPADSATSVTHMAISNRADMQGAEFIPFATSAEWRLSRTTGLATVYMQFRDEAGNLSRIVPNSIFVDDDGSGGEFDESLKLPFVRR